MAVLPTPLADRERVLVIRLGAVGDVLRTLPAVQAIRSAYPAARISWIVEDVSRELLVDHPAINEVVRFPRRELRQAARHPFRLASLVAGLRRDLRDRRFGVSLDFQGSLKSGWLSLMSGAPRRIGFSPRHSRELSFLFANEWVRPDRPYPNRVEKNLFLAAAIGTDRTVREAGLRERDDEALTADAMLRSINAAGRPVVVLAPGTSRRQRHKRWSPESFARVATLLASGRGVLPVVAWGPGEESLADEVRRRSQGSAIVLPPTSLRVLAAVLRRSALFIGADTGPMHLAWVVGCPVIAVFGPTDPRLNAPVGRGHVVLRGGTSTSTVSPQDAVDAACRILDRSDRPAGPLPRESSSVASETSP